MHKRTAKLFGQRRASVKVNPASALISVSLEIPPTFTPKKMFEFPAVSSDPLVAIQALLSRLNNMIIMIEALFRYVCQ